MLFLTGREKAQSIGRHLVKARRAIRSDNALGVFLREASLHGRSEASVQTGAGTRSGGIAKCPKVSNMISHEPIWQEVRSQKTVDSQRFYGVT
jgi:hypothetical protein